MRTLGLVSLLIFWLSTAVLAHGTESHVDAPRWTFDLWVVTPLAVCGALYGLGVWNIWRNAGIGRGIHRLQVLSYVSGWLALAGALTSPLHWLGERLFTAHMIEHEIIMGLAAPLLVLSRPFGAVLWALPRGGRVRLAGFVRWPTTRAVWMWVSAGGVATLLQGVAIWFWHAPVFFDASLTDVGLHRLQHLSFFSTAVLFWWAVFRRSGYGAAAWHLFVTMMHTSMLGALMTLAPRVLYLAQTSETARWGMTPLQDQQLSGLIMWVPAGAIYAAVALVMSAQWIRRSSTRQDHGGQIA